MALSQRAQPVRVAQPRAQVLALQAQHRQQAQASLPAALAVASRQVAVFVSESSGSRRPGRRRPQVPPRPPDAAPESPVASRIYRAAKR